MAEWGSTAPPSGGARRGRAERASGLARRQKLYMREAAHAIAIGRVAKACHERGWV